MNSRKFYIIVAVQNEKIIMNDMINVAENRFAE